MTTYNITIKCDTENERDKILNAIDTLAKLNNDYFDNENINLENIIKFGNDSNVYFSRTREGLENSLFDKETKVI
jgi:ABC-type transporter Mla subunit MlaD